MGQAAKKNQEMKSIRTFERMLPVPLTETEVAARGERMAELRAEIQDKQERKKRIDSKINAECKELEGTLDEVAAEIRNHAFDAMIECEERADFSQNRMLTIRLDSNEVVDERALTASELQGEFDYGAEGTDVVDEGDAEDEGEDEGEDE